MQNGERNKPPLTLFLSEANGPKRMRALFSNSNSDEERLIEIAPEIGKAFSNVESKDVECVLLQSEDATGRWTSYVWQEGALVECNNENINRRNDVYFYSCVWRRLLIKRSISGTKYAFDWAMARGLPVDRTPLAPTRQFRKIPVIDYNVVAQLDQRSLLIEDGPRLYRFVIGGGS